MNKDTTGIFRAYMGMDTTKELVKEWSGDRQSRDDYEDDYEDDQEWSSDRQRREDYKVDQADAIRKYGRGDEKLSEWDDVLPTNIRNVNFFLAKFQAYREEGENLKKWISKRVSEIEQYKEDLNNGTVDADMSNDEVRVKSMQIEDMLQFVGVEGYDYS